MVSSVSPLNAALFHAAYRTLCNYVKPEEKLGIALTKNIQEKKKLPNTTANLKQFGEDASHVLHCLRYQRATCRSTLPL